MPRHDRERTDADSAPDRTRPTGRADATLRRPCSRASAFSGESATEQARRADERSPAPSVVAARAVPGAAARGTDERRAPEASGGRTSSSVPEPSDPPHVPPRPRSRQFRERSAAPPPLPRRRPEAFREGFRGAFRRQTARKDGHRSIERTPPDSPDAE